MKDKIEVIRSTSITAIEKVETLKEVEDLRVEILGKKGKLTDIMKGMKDLDSSERPIIGQLANKLRDELTGLIEEKKGQLEESELKKRLEEESIDITLPGRKDDEGRYHPITETMNYLKSIFINMGFDVAEGPEIEKIEYNFDALNIPETHPSRDLQDTFYVASNVVLRTHTSPVQARYMEKTAPPLRMVCPGRVYRNDYDISHTPMFHQMEGLMIGKDVSFANLKATLEKFVEKVFGETNVRFRPHFFPFTEPSAEMDVECVICKGKGCRVCKNSGWLEILGCGMVDPEVLKAVGYDPSKVSGFAFGMGIERIAMLRHGVNDLRAFFENDVRFLRQFK